MGSTAGHYIWEPDYGCVNRDSDLCTKQLSPRALAMRRCVSCDQQGPLWDCPVVTTQLFS